MSVFIKHADLLTRDMMNVLLGASGGYHVSIFMPTHREWSAVVEDPIRLKNLVAAARQRLVDMGMRPSDATDFLSDAMELVRRDNFWQYQSDALAVFITGDCFRYFRLPIEVDEVMVVGERFFLKPLFDLFVDDGRFYVLALTEHDVSLYQATRHSMREVELFETDVGVGRRPEPREERHTSLHTGAPVGNAAGRERGAVHGGSYPGSATAKKARLARHLHDVDVAVRKALAYESAPLIIAGLKTVRSLYEETNQYGHLVESGLDHDPKHLTMAELHARAFEVIEPVFVEARKNAARAFDHYTGAGSMHVASDIESVLSAAYQHRVAKLFLPRGQYVWGRFDSGSGSVQVHAEKRAGDEELLDLAAAYTIQGNGEVYAVPESEMPEASPVAAVLRY